MGALSASLVLSSFPMAIRSCSFCMSCCYSHLHRVLERCLGNLPTGSYSSGLLSGRASCIELEAFRSWFAGLRGFVLMVLRSVAAKRLATERGAGFMPGVGLASVRCILNPSTTGPVWSYT